MAAFCRLCCGSCFGVKREGLECKSLRRLKREYEQPEPAEAGTTNSRDYERGEDRLKPGLRTSSAG